LNGLNFNWFDATTWSRSLGLNLPGGEHPVEHVIPQAAKARINKQEVRPMDVFLTVIITFLLSGFISPGGF
jgi:hypothetical protein